MLYYEYEDRVGERLLKFRIFQVDQCSPRLENIDPPSNYNDHEVL